uniref:ORF7 protein n=1 Tax=Chaerephon bat coronavirus TaxID=2991261 RepID=A0AB38ZDU6_9NIDO
MDLELIEIWYFIGLMAVDLIFSVFSFYNTFTFVSAIIGSVLICAPVCADFLIEDGFERVMEYYRASHDKFVQLMFI